MFVCAHLIWTRHMYKFLLSTEWLGIMIFPIKWLIYEVRGTSVCVYIYIRCLTNSITSVICFFISIELFGEECKTGHDNILNFDARCMKYKLNIRHVCCLYIVFCKSMSLMQQIGFLWSCDVFMFLHFNNITIVGKTFNSCLVHFCN